MCIMHDTMNVYFDNAATTAVREEVIEKMVSVMRTDFGNPSSSHFLGRSAANELAVARKNIANALRAKPDEIYFTSGGTEANNWAIQCSAKMLARRGKHIITSSIEHDAVAEPIKMLEQNGWEITTLKTNNMGFIGSDAFADALREDTVLASIMHVNNETGAINPIEDYSREIKRRKLGTLLHTDGVQSFCKLPFAVNALGADLVSISAHKLHGPKGIGALYIKGGTKLPAIFLGGSQERGKRAGTEAMPAIAGFGEAVRLAQLEQEENTKKVTTLSEFTSRRLVEELPEAVIISDNGSPYILSISLPGYKSEVLMSYLESEGVCVSKSAACKKGARSRVLEAMRLKNDVIDGALRVSFSQYNTQQEAEYFVQILKKASLIIRK